MTPALYFVVPGSLDTRTGGYGYDRRIIAGLKARGAAVDVVELAGHYPFPSDADIAAAQARFAGFRDDAVAVVDGLAYGVLPEIAASERKRLRLVALVHHPLADEGGMDTGAARRLKDSEEAALRHARHVIVTSPFMRERLGAYGVAPERVSVVVPGTEAAPLAEGTGNGPLRVLCPASYIPRKGHADLLNALGELMQFDWHLTCVGNARIDPGWLTSLRALRERLGLTDRLDLQDEVDDAALAALYLESDLVVLASRYEGYGMVVSEAIARGLPVVTTMGGALRETLPTGAGLSCPPGDVMAFRENLRRVFADRALLAQLKAGAAHARVSLPDWKTSVARFAEILESVAA